MNTFILQNTDRKVTRRLAIANISRVSNRGRPRKNLSHI